MPHPLQASALEAAVRALVVAEEQSFGIEITVPVAYGDGEMVSVNVEQNGDTFSVHDAAIGSMELSASGVSLTKAVITRVSELVARFHCMFENGRVSAHCAQDDLAVTVCLVANASRSVADYINEKVGSGCSDSISMRDRFGERAVVSVLLPERQ